MSEYGDTGPTVQCHQCGRTFAETAFSKHEKICKKVFVEKRKKFNTAQQRLEDFEGAQDLIANATKLEREKETGGQKKREKDSKRAKWRAESESFRAAIQIARATDDGERAAAEAKLAQLEREDDSKVRCPHCGRTFNAEAGKRHMPICQKTFGTKADGGRLRKGSGVLSHSTTEQTGRGGPRGQPERAADREGYRFPNGAGGRPSMSGAPRARR